MLNPVSTYRLQFHKGFTFKDFENILPYLQQLGVKTVYASPVFEATPGSTHGYDGLNPNNINPEIGTLEQLHELSKSLREKDINWLQDIVPNHMAFDPRNPWIQDVLEKGPLSIYASAFDIDWNSPVYEGRLMVPFLGATLEEVIKKGELKIAYADQHFVLKYYNASYPLNLQSYETILSRDVAHITETVKHLMQHIKGGLAIKDAESYRQHFQKSISMLSSLHATEPGKKWIEATIRQINNDTELVSALANSQYYQLSHWQETDHQINYRRFFTVNGLICLNIQDQQVFGQFHGLIETLVKEGVFQGLRVDHIDGLYDPAKYLRSLREVAGDETYIVVEKILEPDEQQPNDWPVQGNTGYDFLATVNNLFTNKAAKKAFTQFYYGIADPYQTIPQQIRDKKNHILTENMGGELDNLCHLFAKSELVDITRLKALPENTLKKAIGSFLVYCPVYRYYGSSLPLINDEAKAVHTLFQVIRQAEPNLGEAISILEEIFLKTSYAAGTDYNNRALHFYQRCMQFSGPLMAKGVEDTLMYTFNRFIGHNEVGDSPEAFGCTVEAFHKKMEIRQQDWPLSINTTATHDTKRGEDFRARLNVVTDMHAEWLKMVTHWQELNNDLKINGAPDANDEYFIYQTLIGSYPMDASDEAGYGERLQEYLQKALREAKHHSNWTSPNEAYETATKNFAVKLLDKSRPFWKSFQKVHEQIVPYGIINSLAQAVLKFTCPGVPDVYQGSERWDFSFVDPDNRRPVDYAYMQKTLDTLSENTTDANFLQDLWENKTDPKIKVWLLYQLLQLRKANAEAFVYGDYVPLKVEGLYKEHILAFARKYKNTWFIVILPLHLAEIANLLQKKNFDWKDTRVVLPGVIKEDWEDLLRGVKGKRGRGLLVKKVFGPMPFALLKMQGEDNKRSAGILLHITSLPSLFGIGDMGPEAKSFADFLHRSKQRYWQLLPINPTEGGQGNSPYSSTSSRAGNIWLISPELLVKEGILSNNFIQQYQLPNEGKTDFEIMERVKMEVFEKAWSNFKEMEAVSLQKEFENFKLHEQEWLPDFALYTVLKQKHKGKPWYNWPHELKNRQVQALQKFAAANDDEIEKVQWLQFLFSRQWKALKTYCNLKKIQLLGDLPIYVSYDSVDVWANREIFKLDREGNRLGMAGVPPDAFSDDGQLWGMPVYNWAVLKERKYDWWVERLRKNSELFDVIRLDHFRAFADYWEVPAGEETARNGTWMQGPGADFFASIKEQLGELPFVAEDLGEINDAVLQLRDDFQLPGMKILQFAFGDDIATSDYIPHNYTQNFIVYTGTHDNNTTRGWYRQDASEEMKNRLQQYLARSVTEAEVTYFFCRMAHASVAKTVILPMQDVLALDEKARMNTPASGKNNWSWRLFPGQINTTAAQHLIEWTLMYNRE